MLSLKKLYNLSFYIVLSLSFLIGGTLQYLFGVSNTVLMIFLGIAMFTNYVAYVFVKRKVIVNWVFLLFSLYALTIIISSLINQTNIINTIVYFNFAFLPLSVYYFLKINKKEGFIKPKSFFSFILFIASIQFPILLIQRNFYNPLINFNNSGQYIASYDFMFGSFLVKSDHSLGCFLLFAIIGLLFNINNVKLYVKNRIFIALYLSLTLFLAESNISKALLVTAWLVFFIHSIYNKIPKSFFNKKFYFVFSLVILSLIAYNVRNIEFITSRLGGTIEENYTIEKSKYFYEEKTAKRLQIIIVAVNLLDTKYIGDGPYSYFDIRTGKFNNTFHFSQVLWSYFDLGLIGLIIALAFMYSLVKSVLSDRKHLIIFIFPISLVYMMYTTVFTEIGILLGLFLIFSLKSNNEFNSNTVPRLEKK
jgi:hypothetical protein